MKFRRTQIFAVLITHVITLNKLVEITLNNYRKQFEWIVFLLLSLIIICLLSSSDLWGKSVYITVVFTLVEVHSLYSVVCIYTL